MNDHEAERIACAMHALRPDWPTASVLTLIRKNLIDRPRRDVTVALAWIACESNSATPARVLESGPWWQAVAVDGTSAVGRREYDESDTCSTCSYSAKVCQSRWADDHPFLSVAAARALKGKVDVSRTVAALKAEVVPVAPSPEPKTLDELCADPRVQAVRDALPGIAVPPNLHNPPTVAEVNDAAAAAESEAMA